MRKHAFCMLVVRYAKRSDDHKWLLERKDIMDFESIVIAETWSDICDLTMFLCPLRTVMSGYTGCEHPVSLPMENEHRDVLFEDMLKKMDKCLLRMEQHLSANVSGEIDIACPDLYGGTLHLKYFNFSGRMIGLALMHKVQVGIVLDRVFFLQLGGYSISLEDIRDADPYMYNSCKQILEMDTEFIDSDALGLTFVREVEELGLRRVVELCDGGKGMVVNSKNRNDYVDLLIKDRFVTSISQQVSHFAQGFGDILSDLRLQKFFFQSLELEDIDQMLHRSENDISVEDWKAHTEYNGYKSNYPQIVWFWKIVSEMSPQQKKNILFFWTSVKYLPVEGFRGLASRLYIYKSTEHVSRLPSSHTCFYRLCFPPYPSMTIMQQCLSIIAQELVGCSFGTQ
ncbi:E3 ubiquitin-protein ligase UPL5-like [Eucalyptus grandis]|uniref:E3 ubiquitin-protein ligase UPL5-like n=1 Tax=Eucalyptus grandis TaxID=71139 RepID=UPI00192EB93A|nr:E3 ubiquitin-protein ligase UPL5-like [Eucalyptus grandis]